MSVVLSLVDQRLGPAFVAAADPTGQIQAVLELGSQLRDAQDRVDAARLDPVDAPGGLVVAGMGGSAIGGRLALGVLADRLRRPLAFADGYELPPWTGADSLVLCSSYSGATEETTMCYEIARGRGASIVVAGAGGPLVARALADGVPVIRLPAGLQPRAAVGYSLVCALAAAALCGAVASVRAELAPAAALLDRLACEWGPNGQEGGSAKALARRLVGVAPVIVGAGATAPVAYRWKCQLNENAKVPAFASVLPEADHNEICAWDAAPTAGAFAAVFLESEDDPPEIRRRVELTARAAGAGALAVRRVRACGETRLERVLSLVLLGDLVSLYVAALRGVDPVEIAAIRDLKASLPLTAGA
ncbi:MAG TPA: bifunctional phosphoglucose/phosphomannose isomerase [Solirubrobacteraceae bacterium]